MIVNNTIIENKKINRLLKQNILALSKDNLETYTQLLYKIPQVYPDETPYVREGILNIDEFNVNKNKNPKLENMLIEYNKNAISYTSTSQSNDQSNDQSQNQNQRQNQNQNQNQCFIENNEDFGISIKKNYKGTTLTYINNDETKLDYKTYTNIKKDTIVIIKESNLKEQDKSSNIDQIFVIYNIRLNIIFVLNDNKFNNFMLEIDHHQYIIISIYTYEYYKYNIIDDEFKIEDDLIKNIIIYSKYQIYSITGNTLYQLHDEEFKHAKLSTYIDFSSKFKLIIYKDENFSNGDDMSTIFQLQSKLPEATTLKYIKYKTKYLALKKKIS
jgi:hypothetical protein